MFIVTKLTDLIFPPLCVHCGREGAWLCPAATSSLDHEPLLIDPLPIRGVDRVITRGSYDCETLAQLIQKLKYHYWSGLSPVLVEVLKPLSAAVADQDVSIIPVPLHHRRQRERGFNQSLFISQALGAITGRPVTDILRRTRYTTPQALLSAKERTTNIIGAFGRGRVVTWPKSAILVDDVITTGSTIAECASVLRQHGVNRITAVALAKG